jgi:hypothetical protein
MGALILCSCSTTNDESTSDTKSRESGTLAKVSEPPAGQLAASDTPPPTIDELDAAVVAACADWDRAHSPLQELRTIIERSRAVVEVRVLKSEDIYDNDSDTWERHFWIEVTSVLGAANNYNVEVREIVTLMNMSEQPKLVVSGRYIIARGAGDERAWRGLSEFDVIDATSFDGESYSFRGAKLLPSDLVSMLNNLGAAL